MTAPSMKKRRDVRGGCGGILTPPCTVLRHASPDDVGKVLVAVTPEGPDGFLTVSIRPGGAAVAARTITASLLVAERHDLVLRHVQLQGLFALQLGDERCALVLVEAPLDKYGLHVLLSVPVTPSRWRPTGRPTRVPRVLPYW